MDEYDYTQKEPEKDQTKLPFSDHWRKHTMSHVDDKFNVSRMHCMGLVMSLFNCGFLFAGSASLS